MPSGLQLARLLCAACATALLAAVAPAALADSRLPAASLTPQSVYESADLVDDHLEPMVTVTTERAHRSTRGLFRSGWNDNHLRAEIDKRTGVARIEVRQRLQYGGLFRGYDQVSYATRGGAARAELSKLADNRSLCTVFDAPATCFEEVAFVVEEADLRRLAASYRAGEPDPWVFKFKAAGGQDFRSGVMRAEVVGLLRRIDDYRAEFGLPAPPAALDALKPEELAQLAAAASPDL